MLTTKSRLNSNKLVYLILGISIISFAAVLLTFGFNEESIRLNIRLSARFSLVCFCFAFIASSSHLLLNNHLTRWLTNNRKYIGISFALIHIIHLAFLIVLHQCFHPVFILRSVFELALGGLAYLFLFLMLLTSFKRFLILFLFQIGIDYIKSEDTGY